LFAAKRRLFSSSVLGALALVWFWNWNTERTTWRVTVLPLAGGESIYIDGPGKSDDLLIDCGTSGSVQFVTEPFLRAQGVNRLPRLLLTHGDLKNVGGATNVIADFKVPQVFVSPVKFRSPAYRQLQQLLDKSAGLKTQISLGQQLGLWEILHPADNDKVTQADEAPLVLRGEIHGTRFLFLSDLGRPGQHLLWQRATNLQADIVIAGLPRESEPLNDALIEAIHPRLIVITDSEFPATERANARLRDRLEQHGIPVVYCRKSGSVSFKIRPNGALACKAMNGDAPEFTSGNLQSDKR
jgi:competence protein ComEC